MKEWATMKSEQANLKKNQIELVPVKNTVIRNKLFLGWTGNEMHQKRIHEWETRPENVCLPWCCFICNFYFVTDTGVKSSSSSGRRITKSSWCPLCLSLATFTMVQVWNILFFLFLRANHQDFQLKNLRIIEPNEVTHSGDPGVQTGNNFAY